MFDERRDEVTYRCGCAPRGPADLAIDKPVGGVGDRLQPRRATVACFRGAACGGATLICFVVFQPVDRSSLPVAKRASRHTRVDIVQSNVEDPDVWKQLIDCDHIFLAADSHTARLLVNAIAHQYLIPVTQIGAKAQVEDTGNVSGVYSVSRPIEPGRTCLRCNGLISSAKLTEEATPTEERKRQRYVNDADVHAPSVITLNAVAASVAVNEWLMRTVGLAQRPITPDWITVDALFGEFNLDGTRKDPDCPWCGTRRYGRGDALPLPAKIG
ncbi:MAG: ThiF family adenylyltransferase [Leifsonia sp.]